MRKVRCAFLLASSQERSRFSFVMGGSNFDPDRFPTCCFSPNLLYILETPANLPLSSFGPCSFKFKSGKVLTSFQVLKLAILASFNYRLPIPSSGMRLIVLVGLAAIGSLGFDPSPASSLFPDDNADNVEKSEPEQDQSANDTSLNETQHQVRQCQSRILFSASLTTCLKEVLLFDLFWQFSYHSNVKVLKSLPLFYFQETDDSSGDNFVSVIGNSTIQDVTDEYLNHEDGSGDHLETSGSGDHQDGSGALEVDETSLESPTQDSGADAGGEALNDDVNSGVSSPREASTTLAPPTSSTVSTSSTPTTTTTTRSTTTSTPTSTSSSSPMPAPTLSPYLTSDLPDDNPSPSSSGLVSKDT